MKTPEEIAQLLFRHTCHELSPQEELELAEWRALSAENEQIFRDANDPEFVRREIRFIYESKDRVYQKIMEQYPLTDTLQKKALPRIYKILRVAAIVVVSLGITLYVLLGIDIGGPGGDSANGISYRAQLIKDHGLTVALEDIKRGYADGYAAARGGDRTPFFTAQSDPQAPAGQYHTMRTAKAQHYGLQLPDSTRIWLNEKSSVKYAANYSLDPGRIAVEGEVYAELAKSSNTNAPFFVSLPNMLLELSSGRFNVSAYTGDSIIITAVAGDLKLDTGSRQPAAAIMLHPGEQAQIIHGQLNLLKNVDTRKIIAWRDNAGKQ